MSKIGKKPIELPKEVKLEIKGTSVLVDGPKGKLSLTLPADITLEQKDQTILIKRRFDSKKLRSLHGLIRALVANMVEGVSKGFSKELEIVGVGYKAQVKNNILDLHLGFSHPLGIPVDKDLKVTCPSPNRIIIEGVDKQKVGQLAATVRKIMPPEPYKGKGIRYKGEQVRKKVGKAMAKA